MLWLILIIIYLLVMTFKIKFYVLEIMINFYTIYTTDPGVADTVIRIALSTQVNL